MTTQIMGDPTGRCETKTVSRRAFLGGVLGTAFLVACGDSDEEASPTGERPAGQGTLGTSGFRLLPRPPSELGAPPVPPATASTASNAVPYESTVAIYSKFGTDAAPGVFPRVIRHAMGETRLQASPQRVVVLDTGEMDALVELGLKPLGVIDWTGAGIPPYLQSSLQGVKIVGSIAEPNLEGIVSLRPDLILSNKLRHEKSYARLGAIAPTIFGERAGLVWRHNFELYAKALGREEQGAKTVSRYEDRVRQLNTKLPKPRPSISVVRVLDNNLRFYQRANFIGIVLTDLGFPRPPSQNVDDFGLINQGLETVGQHGQADVIVVSVVGGESNQFAKQMLESPLWKGVQAVKDGKVLTVDDSIWIAGLGYKAADIVMDDIAKFFKV